LDTLPAGYSLCHLLAVPLALAAFAVSLRTGNSPPRRWI